MDNLTKQYIKQQLDKAIVATEAGELYELAEIINELNAFIKSIQ